MKGEVVVSVCDREGGGGGEKYDRQRGKERTERVKQMCRQRVHCKWVRKRESINDKEKKIKKRINGGRRGGVESKSSRLEEKKSRSRSSRGVCI